MKKLTPRQLKGIETKLKITRTAINLFKKRGFNDVTVRDICEASSISIGTFYHHFLSKDEIINTAHQQIDRLWEERISGYKNINIKEDILYLFEEAGKLMQDLGWDLTSQSYKQLITSQKKYAVQKDRPISIKLHQVMDSGYEQNAFLPDADTEELIETLIRCSRGVLFDWCLMDGSYDLPKKLRHDLSFVLTNFCR